MTPQAFELKFAVEVNGGDFSCAGEYQLGTANTSVKLSDMKFFVSEVAVIDAAGAEVPVTLDDDGMWQYGGVALLDFEDGTGACANGTAPTRHHLTGVHDAAEVVGVRFTVGVPFELNHQDVATAQSPLNLAAMFWSWQGGYKFLRLEGSAEGGAGFRVHVGSTGCEMANGFDVSSCSSPNRIEVSLPSHDVATPVVVDVDALFQAIDMTPDAENRSTVCMSAPDQVACAPLFETLGLPFGGAGSQQQVIFK